MSPSKPRFENDTYRPALRCPACGNAAYFIEIMGHESHIVTGDLTYVRLLHAETERYECCECSAVVELDDSPATP